MSECTWNTRVEAYHDGETALAKGVEEHLGTCADCREYLGMLQAISTGVAASKKEVEIADAQFRVFMDGIREGIERPRFAWGGFFSKLSIYAASFVLVIALAYIFTSGPVRTWARQFIEPTVMMNDQETGQHGGAGTSSTKGDLDQ